MSIDYVKHHNKVKIGAGLVAFVGFIAGLEIDPIEQELIFELLFVVGGFYLFYYTQVAQQRGWIEMLIGPPSGEFHKDKDTGMYYFILWLHRITAVAFPLMILKNNI